MHMSTPKCPYFGTCGGCTFQHIDYSQQLESKKKKVEEALNKDGKKHDIKVFNAQDYNYRNRMDFIFHRNGLGLRKKGDWRAIIDIKHCDIAEEHINKILEEVRLHFKDCDYFDNRKNSGTFRYAVIRTASSSAQASESSPSQTKAFSSVSFVLNSDSSRLQDAIEKIKDFAEKASATNVAVAYVHSKTDTSVSDDSFMIKGEEILMQEYCRKKFYYSIQGFFQNNHVMAEVMHAYCRNLLKGYGAEEMHLLDLYGGVGTFAIINADLFKTALTVESVKQCTDSAEKNIEENKAENCKALTLDARYIKKLELPQPLIVITDPPRSGMHPDTILHLNKIKPKLIIYVSCNLEQLEKDIPKFKDYELRSAALFDLFPQTPHSETIIELRLKDDSKK